MDLYLVLGRNLRTARRSRSMTLEQLETAASVDASFIGQIERGAKKPSLATIGRLAAGLRMPAARLLAARAPNAASGVEARIAVLLRAHGRARAAFLYDVLRWLSRRLGAARPARAGRGRATMSGWAESTRKSAGISGSGVKRSG